MGKYNFGEVEAQSFEALPKGTYDAVIYEYEEDTVRDLEDGEEPGKDGAPKNPGADMLKWTFKITEDGFENRRAWMNTVLAGNGLGMLKGLIIASGLYSEEEVNDPDFDFDPDELLGENVRLRLGVSTNPRTKEKNNSVKAVLPANSSGDKNELP